MAKFVIHKKGFFYTDEAFEAAENTHGSIVASFENLEDAQKAKHTADILSMQKLKGMNAVDFFFNSNNYEQVYQQFENFYKSEFDLSISDKYYFNLPKEISTGQAQRFLEILNVSFHNIVQYDDDKQLDPASFDLQEQELDEF
ncbi:MAG: hypothetical protein WCF67_24005 [Chitinophagaceae bacterium]